MEPIAESDEPMEQLEEVLKEEEMTKEVEELKEVVKSVPTTEASEPTVGTKDPAPATKEKKAVAAADGHGKSGSRSSAVEGVDSAGSELEEVLKEEATPAMPTKVAPPRLSIASAAPRASMAEGSMEDVAPVRVRGRRAASMAVVGFGTHPYHATSPVPHLLTRTTHRHPHHPFRHVPRHFPCFAQHSNTEAHVDRSEESVPLAKSRAKRSRASANPSQVPSAAILAPSLAQLPTRSGSDIPSRR